jgi:SagB-type dehydrogenase family enzyme
MNKNLQSIFKYHEETKHAYGKYARSIGYMDWANQPDPFRSYAGASHVELPLAFDNPTAPYHLIFTDTLPAAPLHVDSISQFLQFSMGISAIKSNGYNEWALRCNASSGNLQPSESYVILPPVDGINTKTTISHYAPKDHSLEILSQCDSHMWDTLPAGSFFVALSSIAYREVWKYGERAFRYTNLDAGHAQRSLQVSAKTLGWKYRLISNIEDKELATLFGFDKKNRFNENENETADMLLLIAPCEFDGEINYRDLLDTSVFDSVANNIADTYQNWPLIGEIEDATFSFAKTLEKATSSTIERSPTKEAKAVILKRRSAQMMDENNNQISYKQFKTIVDSSLESFNGFKNAVNLAIFVHSVEELESGLYMFLRNKEDKASLVAAVNQDFLWNELDENLFFLAPGDFRTIAKNISCTQDIASDGAFTLGMLSHFADDIIENGEHRYKELYWECGAIGQQLYLETTSLNLSATGIGCYLDDLFHKVLGLKSNKFQSLYHFTVGRGLVDSRLLTKHPYENRIPMC